MSNYSQFIGGGAGSSGVSGYSGASGGAGATGASGYSGAVGPAGSTGTSGYSGISGWSGSAGSTSLTSTYVAYGSGSNTITGSVQLTWDDTSRILTIGSLTHGNGTTIIGQTQNTGLGVPGTLVVSGAVGNSSGGDLVIKGGQSGGSVPGGNLYIQAGNSLREGDGGSNTGPTLYLRAGTGGGAYPAPGVIVFQTSNLGDVPQVYVERMRMRGTGALSFGSTGSDYGTSGQVLTSNGDAPPSWQTQSGAGSSGFSGFSGFSGVNAGLPALFAARATSTGQTFNGNTALDLSTLVYEDVSGMVNLTTNRLIVPTGCDRAIFNIIARPVTANTSLEYYTTIYRNGSAISSSNRATRTFNGMTESTGTLSVSAGDYFTVDINTASGATTHVVDVSLLCWNSAAATVSGYSGRSGYSGVSGYSGISGFSGFSGIAGAFAASGLSGYSGLGTSGFSGYSGVTPDLSSYVTLTGTQTLTNKTYTGVKETRVAMVANDVDITLGNYFTKTITTTTAFTASNVPSSGTTASFVMELTNAGSQTITWFTGTTWASGVAPTLTVSGVDILGFYTFDAGSTWRGLVLALDIK